MEKLKALLITGEHIHDWKKSTSFVKGYLEGTNKFIVNIAEYASKTLENYEFIKSFDFFIMDYHGSEWSSAARYNFEKVIRDGMGLLLLHGTGVGFTGYTEFEKMAGLLWRDDTFHGDCSTETIKIVNKTHPITKGIEDFQHFDEWYCSMINVQKVPIKVLAEVYSDEKVLRWDGRGGSGKNEPMLIENSYGKARIIYLLLGHVWVEDFGNGFEGYTLKAFEDEGYKKLLTRCADYVGGRI